MNGVKENSLLIINGLYINELNGYKVKRIIFLF